MSYSVLRLYAGDLGGMVCIECVMGVRCVYSMCEVCVERVMCV